MRWVRWVFVVYLAAVLSLTLWPSLDQTAVPGWAQATVDALARLGITATVSQLEMLSNVVMFVPFGVLGAILLAHARRRWAFVAVILVVGAAGFAFSGLIETAQLGIPGRVSTWTDVGLNGIGAFAGAVAGAEVFDWIERRRRRPAVRSVA